KKWEAEHKLRDIIEKATHGNGPARPDDSVTFRWFWEKRFFPLQGKWRRSTKDAVVYVMDHHVLPKFGSLSLRDLDRFQLQSHVNDLANTYSRSVVEKFKVWV